MRKAFSFYRSHYEQMKLLNNKQVADVTMAICEVQFLEKNIDDISFQDKMTQLVWTGIRHAVDASVKGYVNAKKGDVDMPLVGGSKNSSTTLEEEEVQEEEEYPRELNIEAFKMWCKHKGSKYSKQGKTISRNKLVKYSYEQQMEMVENSIMNNYKGLFEIKAPRTNPANNLDIANKDYGNGGSF